MEIQTIIPVKQCQQYHDAVEKQDWYAANLFYMPPIHKSWERIESEMRSNELIMNHKAEMKRIEEMGPEMLEIEAKMKSGWYDREHEKEKRRSIFEIIFGIR